MNETLIHKIGTCIMALTNVSSAWLSNDLAIHAQRYNHPSIV